MWKSKLYGALVLNHRVVLHAIDATPARWRGGVGSPPLDGASAAASSPRNDFVKNYRVRPKHRLLSTQVQSYQVEWDTNPGVAEVQTVTTSTYLGANELQTIRTFGKDLCGNQPVRRVFLGDDAAALAPSSGEEPASPRHRAGVASMAWRTTR